MRFKAKKATSLTLILLASFALPIVIILKAYPEILKISYIGFFMFLPAGVLSYLYFGTVYHIKNMRLHYRSALTNGVVNINSIHEIIKSKPGVIGLEPATSDGGIWIKYDLNRELYLSPQDNESLINALQKLNPNIKVVS